MTIKDSNSNNYAVKCIKTRKQTLMTKVKQ